MPNIPEGYAVDKKEGHRCIEFRILVTGDITLSDLNNIFWKSWKGGKSLIFARPKVKMHWAHVPKKV